MTYATGDNSEAHNTQNGVTMLRWNALLAIASCFVLAPVSSPSWQAVIDQDIWVPAPPLGHCVVPELAGIVFKATVTPGGHEYLPGRCGSRAPAAGERENLRGLTAREALDRLVQLDARYRWVDRDGVLVVRPVTAWDDANHFLHRTISVAFVDQNVGGALFALLTAIGPTKYTGSGERTFNTVDMNRRFTVSLDATPALEALNAVVRTHGRLQWLVGYCQPESKAEFAMVMLHTFDDGGIGGQPGVPCKQ
jgi:hypothetical protein